MKLGVALGATVLWLATPAFAAEPTLKETEEFLNNYGDTSAVYVGRVDDMPISMTQRIKFTVKSCVARSEYHVTPLGIESPPQPPTVREARRAMLLEAWMRSDSDPSGGQVPEYEVLVGHKNGGFQSLRVGFYDRETATRVKTALDHWLAACPRSREPF